MDFGEELNSAKSKFKIYKIKDLTNEYKNDFDVCYKQLSGMRNLLLIAVNDEHLNVNASLRF